MSADRSDLDELRRTVAIACRILGHTGLAREVTGHVSGRIRDLPGAMLLRCRTRDEAGLAATSLDAIRVVDIATGEVDDPDLADVPVELPIHTALMAARPDIGAVVHVHPRYCLLCGLAQIPLRPIYGAYDHHATVTVEAGVPVYDSSLLVRDHSAALDLVTAMGSASVCLMRGHGITVVGASVEQATLRAVRIEHLAEMTWMLRSNGYEVELPEAELHAFLATLESPVLPRGEAWAFRSYAHAAGLDGLH